MSYAFTTRSVAHLAGAWTQAVTLAGLLKKHGNEPQRDREALLYTEAKAESDAVLAGLLVALDQRGGPAALPDLEARLQHAVERGKALADHVAPLLPDRGAEGRGRRPPCQHVRGAARSLGRGGACALAGSPRGRAVRAAGGRATGGQEGAEVSDDDFNGPADRCSDLVDAMLQEGHDPGASPRR